VLQLRPQRVEGPLLEGSGRADLPDGQRRGRHGHLLVRSRAAVVHLEGPIDQQRIQAEEAEHRPRAESEKNHAGEKAYGRYQHHENEEAAPGQ
jgi:hypothetical protein